MSNLRSDAISAVADDPRANDKYELIIAIETRRTVSSVASCQAHAPRCLHDTASKFCIAIVRSAVLFSTRTEPLEHRPVVGDTHYCKHPTETSARRATQHTANGSIESVGRRCRRCALIGARDVQEEPGELILRPPSLAPALSACLHATSRRSATPHPHPPPPPAPSPLPTAPDRTAPTAPHRFHPVRRVCAPTDADAAAAAPALDSARRSSGPPGYCNLTPPRFHTPSPNTAP